MSNLFDRLMGRKEPSSAEVAKERLKLVLVTDRSNLSPDKLAELQNEIIEVIKRYIEFDEMEVQINIEQRERKHFLVADIPLQRERPYEALDYNPAEPQSDQAVAVADDAAEEDASSNTSDETGGETGEESPAEEPDETGNA